MNAVPARWGAALLALLLLAPAAAGADTLDDLRRALGKGRYHFRRACGLCHRLSRPLERVMTAAEWAETVKRMSDHGAPLNRKKREAVAAYLAAYSDAARTCGGCHEAPEPRPGGRSPQEWAAKVEEMVRRGAPDLPPGRRAAVAAYLSLDASP